MTAQSRRTAGILLVVLPTVIYGGVAILGLLVDDLGISRMHCARISGEQGTRTPVFCFCFRS